MRAVAGIAVQLKDNEELVAKIGDAIQAGIQAAQEELDQANDERMLQEVNRRHLLVNRVGGPSSVVIVLHVKQCLRL